MSKPRLVAALLMLLASCGGEAAGPATTLPPSTTAVPKTTAAELQVSSPAFTDGAAIPVVYTCEGASVSPPLQWSGVPSDAAELAIVVDDPDAPGGRFVHWIVFNLPANLTAIEEGKTPRGAHVARSDGGPAAYFGLCPPVGEKHTYRFRVHAVRPGIAGASGAPGAEVLASIEAYTIARGEVTGTFQRA